MARYTTHLTLKELEQLEREGTLGYRMPDNQVLLDIAETEMKYPSVTLSPDKTWLMFCDYPKYTPFSYLAAPEISVAGIRLHSKNFNKSRGRSYIKSLSVLNMAKIREEFEKKEIEKIELESLPILNLPEPTLIRSVSWSPDSKFFSFLIVKEENVELWITDVATRKSSKVASEINCSLAMKSYVWSRTSRNVYFMKASNKGKLLPSAPLPPFSPAIHSNLEGNVSAARTYQNLLKSKHDEEIFKFFATSSVSSISLTEQGELNEEKELKHISGILSFFSLSPSGNYLMTKMIEEPFSYLVPYSRFPNRTQIWKLNNDENEEIVFEQFSSLQEQIPSIHDATKIGPRFTSWIPTSSDTLYWVEAQDGGDPRVEVETRDKLYTHSAPFTKEATLLCETKSRFYDVDFSSDGFFWVEEREWKKKWQKMHKINVLHDFTPAERKTMFDRSYEDVYNSPGSIWVSKNAKGKFVIPTHNDGNCVLFNGSGATKKGYLPFLDRYCLQDGSAERLWRCKEGFHENIVLLLEDDGSMFITTKQTPNENPNFWLHKKEGETFVEKQMTCFPHPYPWMTDIQQELVSYERPDGVLLSGKLMIPSSFKVGVDEPLPMIIWAYPREFTSAEAANQVKISPSTFTTVSASSPVYWVTQGYAVLMSASMPIISEKKTFEDVNVTFIEQLISNAKTHVDEMVERKIANSSQIAIAGHSYGAFMTANLLAHTTLFCAGIARSGAYNRSLTPFGFQAEDKNLWGSGDLYYRLSPFNHAHQIKSPLLLIHGESDGNSGTHTEQSIRFYNALKGNGCVTRLVVLPKEDHSYKAKENILHLLWETDFWLNQFVKTPQQ